jgi:glucose/arabinose dehydrogenase
MLTPTVPPVAAPWRRATLIGAVVTVLATGCSGSPASPPGPTVAGSSTGSSVSPSKPSIPPTADTSAPADAAPPVRPPVRLTLRPVRVTVPAALRQAPFNKPRELSVPPGWRVSVFARVPKARFLAVTPDGGLLVSQPSTGRVLLVRRGADGTGQASPFLTGLRQPHDLVIATLGGRTWLYVAESNQVRRYPYQPGDRRARPGQTVVGNLPDAGTPGLRGEYAHALKNIAIGPDHRLYVSIGSSCNVCTADTESTPRRAAIYRYALAGGSQELFATGLRNAEGLDFIPDTGDLWAVVNSRDDITYPYHQDGDGDGSDDYGKVLRSYVDDHPPDEFVHVKQNAFYGWPFCNPNPDRTLGMRDLPFERDVGTNADGHVDCATASRIEQGIAAHSAPLGLTFLERTNAPAMIRPGAVVALHGSWDRTNRTGYKVVWFAWDYSADRPAAQQDLVTGWVASAGLEEVVWGRPVDLAVDRDGSLLLSDDGSGTIYRLTSR